MQIDHGLAARRASLAPPVARRRVRVATVLLPLVGLALAVVAVFPVLYMFSASLMQPEQVGSTPLQLLPHPVRWRNFGDIFSQFNIGHYLVNSVFVAAARYGIRYAITIKVAMIARERKVPTRRKESANKTPVKPITATVSPTENGA